MTLSLFLTFSCFLIIFNFAWICIDFVLVSLEFGEHINNLTILTHLSWEEIGQRIIQYLHAGVNRQYLLYILGSIRKHSTEFRHLVLHCQMAWQVSSKNIWKWINKTMIYNKLKIDCHQTFFTYRHTFPVQASRNILS